MVSMAEIISYNPWWKDPAAIDDDAEIRELQKSRIKFVPELEHAIKYDFAPDNTVIYTMRGPRQVGKTTLLKIQIKKFLKGGVQPWNILYCPLDIADKRTEITDIIKTYMRISQTKRSKSRCYMFLDEASAVKDWQKSIKILVDGRKLHNCTIMATGSDAANIKRASEKLPNRRGRVGDNDHIDKIMRPMKFSEYVTSQDEEIQDQWTESTWRSDGRRDILMNLADGNIDRRIDKMMLHKETLDHLFERYMVTGGIPRIVNEMVGTGMISEETYKNYTDGIMGGWNALSKSQRLLKNFCRVIIENQSNSISWNHLSKKANIGIAKTSAEYAESLDDLFVLSVINRYKISDHASNMLKERKLYFQDPFFFHIFNGMGSDDGSFMTSLRYVENEENAGKMTEGIVADHLIRWLFAQSKNKHKFDHDNHLFYWRENGRKEVDFILNHDASAVIPIEVKFRNTINLREMGGMTRFLDRTGKSKGIIVSKHDLEEKKDYTIIPAPIFLLLL
ncbi:MAG: ATP-binding protein [Nitrosopumilus sp. H8]|nr:MAG: ATP-binding protein [Nitrosopumilus sp. H8]